MEHKHIIVTFSANSNYQKEVFAVSDDFLCTYSMDELKEAVICKLKAKSFINITEVSIRMIQVDLIG